MSDSVLIGQVHQGTKKIEVTETPVDLSTVSLDTEFTVKVSMGSEAVDLTSAQLKILKKVLYQAERRLQLRREQLLLANNLQLDFHA